MMLRGDCREDVFKLLSKGIETPCAYVRLRNPLVGETGGRILDNLKAVADFLRDKPSSWADLIRHRNWRYTIVGCSAALLTRETRFLDDLLSRFRQGSSMSPLLAVALGLIHPVEASTEFERILLESHGSEDFGHAFSAYAVLGLLGHDASTAFEASALFKSCQAFGGEGKEAGRARIAFTTTVPAVRSHWEFWKGTFRPFD
jgi:hypothetical protein